MSSCDRANRRSFTPFQRNVWKMKIKAHNSTNITEDAEVNFPHHLYSQASKASAEDKLRFTIQILEEMAALFEEDHSNASWEENTVDHFLIVVTQQADGLHSCMKSHGHKKQNKKLRMYFKRLSHIMEQMLSFAQQYGADARGQQQALEEDETVLHLGLKKSLGNVNEPSYLLALNHSTLAGRSFRAERQQMPTSRLEPGPLGDWHSRSTPILRANMPSFSGGPPSSSFLPAVVRRCRKAAWRRQRFSRCLR
ncbi:Interferon a3 [Liparis tanakae]|uniref:Interferon a3 n=1 Tax=Liparis tanakae TaxID=230148 RepID=A0A4Z2J3P2_9TELE|nr:Interferon a3 [Liparis tanakae]